jgi:hypothetical protein
MTHLLPTFSSSFVRLVATAFIILAPAMVQRSQAQGVDIEVIFNCSAGGPLGQQAPKQCVASRNVLFGSCTSCHTFVPIVKARKSADSWKSLMQVHRERVGQVSEEDYAQLELFLVAHFNETNPVPALPPELENLGTNLPE